MYFHVPNYTSSSPTAERRAAGQGGLVMAKTGRLELGDNIYRHYTAGRRSAGLGVRHEFERFLDSGEGTGRPMTKWPGT